MRKKNGNGAGKFHLRMGLKWSGQFNFYRGSGRRGKFLLIVGMGMGMGMRMEFETPTQNLSCYHLYRPTQLNPRETNLRSSKLTIE